MNVDTDSALVGVLFMGGMTLPVIGSLLGHDVISLYLSGSQFIYSVAVAFGLIAWVFLEVVNADRLNFISWALVFPWIFVFGIAALRISMEGHPGLTYLLDEMGDLVAYSGSFMVTGLASMVIHERIHRVSRQYRSVPRGRTIATGLAIVVVVAILTGGGLLTVSAMSASVTDVEPGVVDHRTPVLNVTVEGRPTEMRLRVTGPEGSSHIRRIPHSQKTEVRKTIPVKFYGDLATSPKAGTYLVELEAISGITVDTMTYTVEDGPTPSVLEVETAGPGEPLAVDFPESATVYRPSSGPTDPETRVAVVIVNTGDIAADFDTIVHLRPGLIDSREIFVKPGQTGVNIIAIQDKYVNQIHERTNGTTTVEVVYEDTRIVKEVTLPQSS